MFFTFAVDWLRERHVHCDWSVHDARGVQLHEPISIQQNEPPRHSLERFVLPVAKFNPSYYLLCILQSDSALDTPGNNLCLCIIFHQNSGISQNVSLSSGLNVQELVQNLSSKDLGKFEEVLAGISSQRTAASKAEWNIYNSIFFCMTVTTTIGKQVI